MARSGDRRGSRQVLGKVLGLVEACPFRCEARRYLKEARMTDRDEFLIRQSQAKVLASLELLERSRPRLAIQPLRDEGTEGAGPPLIRHS